MELMTLKPPKTTTHRELTNSVRNLLKEDREEASVQLTNAAFTSEFRKASYEATGVLRIRY